MNKRMLMVTGLCSLLGLGASLLAGCGGSSETGGSQGSGASGAGGPGCGGGMGGQGGQGGRGGAENKPPTVCSTPQSVLKLWQALGGKFQPNQVFISSSRTDEIRVYDASKLEFVQAFTHPFFSKIDSDAIQAGPNGAAFNARGNLVVAAHDSFVEFSDYGVEYATYPKATAEPTENVIFDARGNLYTTTSSGGTNKLNQYAAADYSFVQTITLPASATSLTGITFDEKGRLYVASQDDLTIHVAQADDDFETFTWVQQIAKIGAPGHMEGLQFNANGELVVAGGDLVRIDVSTGMVLGKFDAPEDAFPVPLRVDNLGNIYTADFENGQGSVAADIFKFTPDGSSFISANDPGLLGPFGLAISGTVLPGDPPVKYTYQVVATDPDGDSLSYSLVAGPPGMTIDAQSGLLTWMVTSKDVGTYDVEIAVSDGEGGVVKQAFQLEISGQ